MAKYKKFLGLGIAGNFALHLTQAGEDEDFSLRLHLNKKKRICTRAKVIHDHRFFVYRGSLRHQIQL